MKKKKAIVALSIAISVSAIGWLIYTGYDDFLSVLSRVHTGYLVMAFFAACATYLFMGLSLWEVLRVLDNKVHLGAAISIAFVSTTANYIVSSMGASGFALRAHLLEKRKVPFGRSVTVSVLLTMLLYTILALLVFQGCLFLIIRSNGARLQVMEGFIGVVALLGVAFALGTAFLDSQFRSKWMRLLFRGINHIIYRFSGGQIPQEDFDKFELQLESGIKTIHENKHRLAGAIAFVCCDWICTMSILYLGFKAVGVSMAVGPLVAGFALGMVTTLIPVLPGGLGAMELTMTATYASLGVPWNSALVACLIYRTAYYVLPALASVFIYWGLKMSEPLDLTAEKEAVARLNEGKA